jgi:hypothetical protein
MMLKDQVHKNIGWCVHALAQDPDDSSVIYRQDHAGMFLTRGVGEHSIRLENGLPSRFGFALAIDRRSRTLYCIPEESDEVRVPPEGGFRVYRSQVRGGTREPLSEGLPDGPSSCGVLRSALSVDHLDPGGIDLGTTSGTLHLSRDSGNSWTTYPAILLRILTVVAFPES